MTNDRELILTFFSENFESGKIYTSYQTLKFKYNDIYNLVIKETKYLDELDRLISFNERLYHIINNLVSIQRCKICGSPVRFVNYNTGYNKYCSSQCSYLDDEIKDKRKDTNIKKYGVDNPLKNKDIVEKRTSTIFEKYGVNNVSQLDDIKNRKLLSSLEKYGTEYVFQSDEVKDKIKKTLLEKYNVDNIAKSEYFQILKKKAYYCRSL